MRLHHLSVTAFGPFVETARVDFDALCDAGLFLLSGATGAGKSSVLDAVCFALYAAVPGDRQDAGRLRADQAPLGLAPEVSLEATLSGRRFRVVRSPAWERPKKRGSGTTREQARVTVSERCGDGWVHLTSRLDEAGDLLSGLLGMNLDQFCQVALLPQGHFQAFLRAKPDERQRLLARLFHTGRFERVEGWLRDHRLALRRASETHAQAVADLVSRVSEAAHRPVPERSDDPVCEAHVRLAVWADDVRDEASTRRTTSAADAVQASSAYEAAAAALTTARDLATSRSRVVAAAETVERLDAERHRHLDEVARLERARRADGVRPLSRLVDERRQACVDAEERAACSRAEAARAGIDVDAVPEELERMSEELATLTALLPTEQLLDELRGQETHRLGQLQELTRATELADAEAASLAALQRELRAAVEAADAAARDVPAAERAVDELRTVATARADVVRLTAEHAATAEEHAAARRSVVDLREHLLDLRERRIAGMAAELAGGLVVGSDCPVCGSAEHPHPARPAGAQPDADAEHTAQRAVDDAQAVELALQLRVRELAMSLEKARRAAGGSESDDVRHGLADAERALAELRARVAEVEPRRARLEETSIRSAELTDRAAERRVRRAELEADVEHLRTRAAEAESQVVAARGSHAELRTAVESLAARRDRLRSVRSHAMELDVAREALAVARAALGRAVLEAGFGTPDEAREALLSAEATAALERSVHDHRTHLAAARQALDEPGSWELLALPDPDLPGAEARAREAADALERCRAAERDAARTDDRVGRLTDELAAALGAWAPVRRQLALATRVSAFAEGKAPDNRLQMRLTAYVLAFRLSQVVAAANARLARMSDQRYALEHVGRRGAGETRGGLSLAIRDDWSGEARDPATLSGGETFVVSLALALGLADVVTQETGGADLQTLFVDEGFGSLDAETLDDVLDILDALRENGRAVGVVSHVAEMRDRIPTQLVVGKGRAGSTLHVVR